MVNTFLPRDLEGACFVRYIELILTGECRKAARTIRQFVREDATVGPDAIIPSRIIENAKGLAVITVLKAGFVWSGRAGAGLVIAKLSNGSTVLARSEI